MIRAHQPGSEPIDIPETIPNPVVVPKPTPTPTEPAPKEPVRIPEKFPRFRPPGRPRAHRNQDVHNSVAALAAKPPIRIRSAGSSVGRSTMARGR